LLGTRMGAKATECLDKGKYGVLVGLIKGEITTLPLIQAVSNKKELDLSLLNMARALNK
jgi:6-phosphofructokinase 1